MSSMVCFRFSIPLTIEFTISEKREAKKDYRIIDRAGNSLLFHKEILKTLSKKFDYLNRFCGDSTSEIEQMKLHSLGYMGLQALHDLIYHGSFLIEEKHAWDLCEQLQILQLPIVYEPVEKPPDSPKEASFESNTSIGSELVPRNPSRSGGSDDCSLLMVPSRYCSNDSEGENQENDESVRWIDLGDFGKSGLGSRDTSSQETSTVTSKRTEVNVQSTKTACKRDMTHIHRVTLTSMTNARKVDNRGNRETRRLAEDVKETQYKINYEKEKFLADFGLYYSSRPITRSLIKSTVAKQSISFPAPKSIGQPRRRSRRGLPATENHSVVQLEDARNEETVDTPTRAVNRPAGTSKTIVSALIKKKQDKVMAVKRVIRAGPRTKTSPKVAQKAVVAVGKRTAGKPKSTLTSPMEDPVNDPMDVVEDLKDDASDLEDGKDYNESTECSESDSDDCDRDSEGLPSKDKKHHKGDRTTERWSTDYVQKRIEAFKRVKSAIRKAIPESRNFKIKRFYECFICSKRCKNTRRWKSHILREHYGAKDFCFKCGNASIRRHGRSRSDKKCKNSCR